MPKDRHPPRGRSWTRPPADSSRPHLTGKTDSYRPSWRPRDNENRSGETRSRDIYHPGQDGRRERREEELPTLPPVRSAVTKRKHQRDTNPSTRIHSIRRQLELEGLPGTVRQEKERELAALLLEQEKTKIKQDTKKNLQRYHFVRFMERQKSERQLKNLIKQRESCKDENARSELEKQIHSTEVDLNYAKYAPLGDKYIGLFPHKKKDITKKRQGLPANKLDFAMLNKEQQKEIREEYEEAANVSHSVTGVKPPLWYQVEKLMEQGVAHLEALRDGKLTTANQLKTKYVVVGGKKDAQIRDANGPESEATPDWVDDNGVIDPADLDSDQDEEMSDGGFFER